MFFIMLLFFVSLSYSQAPIMTDTIREFTFSSLAAYAGVDSKNKPYTSFIIGTLKKLDGAEVFTINYKVLKYTGTNNYEIRAPYSFRYGLKVQLEPQMVYERARSAYHNVLLLQNKKKQ